MGHGAEWDPGPGRPRARLHVSRATVPARGRGLLPTATGVPVALPLIAILALAALLRFATLGGQSFGEDESVTVQLLRGSFGSMLDAIPRSENTPPLYYVLAWGWSRPLGLGEVGLRSLSALVGTATVLPAAAAAATFVRRHHSAVAARRAGLVTAALVAVNPFLIWYAQESRSYALLVLLSTTGLWLFLRALEEPTLRVLLAWGVCSALALATHYFAGLPVLVESLVLVATVRPRVRVAWALAAPVLAGAALLPLVLAQRMPKGIEFSDKFQVPDESLGLRILRIPRELLFGHAAPASRPLSILLLLIALIAVATFASRREQPSLRMSLLVGAVAVTSVALPAAAALVGGPGADYVVTRNLLPALPAAWVLIGGGIALSRRVRLLAVTFCLCSLVSVAGMALDGRYQRPDFRAGAAAAIIDAEPTAVIMTRRLPGPLLLYLGQPRAGESRRVGFLPPAGARVRELAVVSLPRPREERPPSLADLRPPAPGFFVVERRNAPTFELVRFRALRAQLVTPRGLRASSPLLAVGAVALTESTVRAP